MLAESPILTIQNLVVRYRGAGGENITALRVPELVAARGEILTVAGRSGTGKTTLLNAIAGLINPTEGSIRICEHEVTALSEPARDAFRARYIGYVHQHFNLLPAFTALENVLLAMSFVQARSRAQQRARAVELLQRLGLAGRLHHRPGQLSGGEQQRVAMARALANDPLIILADEPTANLDQQTTEALREQLFSLAADRQVTVVLATHDPALLVAAPRIVHLNVESAPQTTLGTAGGGEHHAAD